MVKGLYTGYTGMVNEQKRMDVIANNLANSATTGYKKEGMVTSLLIMNWQSRSKIHPITICHSVLVRSVWV